MFVCLHNLNISSYFHMTYFFKLFVEFYTYGKSLILKKYAFRWTTIVRFFDYIRTWYPVQIFLKYILIEYFTTSV